MRTREREVAIHIGERNDHGGSPELNRDALGHASLLAGHLLVLASGTGGTGGGRVEGNLAVSAVLTHFRTSSDAPISDRLVDSLRRADELLAARGAQDPSVKGSGASCAAILVQEGYCHAARAGDVRAFVVRAGQAHELAGESSEMADQSEMDARSPAARIGALGGKEQTCIHVLREPLKLVSGDRIVLASPGLLNQLDRAELSRVSSTLVPQVAAGRLVDAARKAGASGGISVQIVQYGDQHTHEKSARPVITDAPSVVLSATTNRGAVQRAAVPPPKTAPSSTSAPSNFRADSAPLLAAPATRQPNSPVTPRPTPKIAPKADQITDEPSEFSEFKYEASEYVPEPDNRPRPAVTNPPRKPGNQFRKFGDNIPTWMVPAGSITLGITLLMLWWSPWTSDDPSTNGTTNPITSPSGQEAMIEESAPRAAQPGAPAPLGDPPSRPEETHFADPSPSEPSELLPTNSGLVDPTKATDGFWSGAISQLQTGKTIPQATVRGWLEKNGATGHSEVAAAAKARLAELRRLETTLLHLTAPPQVLTDALIAELDAIFTAPVPLAVTRLKKAIETGFQTHGDKIFEAVSAYVSARRDPRVAAILLAFSESKVGPKTKTWLSADLHRMLVGMPTETNVLRLEPIE